MLRFKSKTFAGALVATTLGLGVAASAASAAPATFVTPVGAGLVGHAPGGITLSWGTQPEQNRTCVVPNSSIVGGVQNIGGQGTVSPLTSTNSIICTDGYGLSYITRFQATAPLLANKNAGAFTLDTTGYLKVYDTGAYAPLQSQTTAVSWSVPFTNGTTGLTGGNPSRLTFNNTLVGYVNHPGSGTGPLRVTGTINVGNNPTTAALTLQ